MTEDLALERLTVRYFGRKQPALADLSLVMRPGRISAVAGRTGAGKSTLCLSTAGFVPRVVRADVKGQVRLGELDVTSASLADLAGRVGIVFSSPALQLSSSKPNVREELAFGLENLAVPRSEMDGRIDAALDRLGIAQLADREPLALSGGEQQRVAIASILVMGTGAIVLDEPAAQLDPQGTADVAAVLRELAADGRAVLVAEHAPEVLGEADSCLVLDRGQQVALDQPARALAAEILRPIGLEPPTLVALADAAGVSADRAFDEVAISRAISGLHETGRLKGLAAPGVEPVARPVELSSIRGSVPVGVEVRDLWHRYPGGVEAVRGVSLDVQPGESVAIIGQNGSGKTTLVKHLNGLLRPDSGAVEVAGRDIGDRSVSDIAGDVGFVFQNPDEQLFNSRVDQEVGFGPRNLYLEPGQVDRLVEGALALVGLTEERSTNPYDLGFSLRTLVALASVLAMEPPLLVLDEPTTGQDGPGVQQVGAIVDAYSAAGRTVIAISHDMEFVARHFRRVVVMRQGEVVLDAPPERVFAPDNTALLASTGLVPPPAARIAARLGLDGAPADAASLLAALGRVS
jgi:energy-coupling factor transporter ATP-binding protein EcfA2